MQINHYECLHTDVSSAFQLSSNTLHSAITETCSWLHIWGNCHVLYNILRHLKVYCHCFFPDTHNRCNDENGTPPENWNTLSKTERYLCTRLCWPDRYRMMIINVCLGLVTVSRMVVTANSVIRYSEKVLTMYLLRLFTGVRKTYPQLLTVKLHLILKATPWKMVMNVTKTFWEWFVTITWCHVGQSR